MGTGVVVMVVVIPLEGVTVPLVDAHAASMTTTSWSSLTGESYIHGSSKFCMLQTVLQSKCYHAKGVTWYASRLQVCELYRRYPVQSPDVYGSFMREGSIEPAIT